MRDGSNPTLSDPPPPILSVSTPDKLLWRRRDGSLTPFSVRDVWLSICPSELDTDWHHLVWFSQNIPRHAFILWVAMNRRLKTHDRLHFWEAYPTFSCGFCHNGPDSHDHLFFECPYPNQVWNGLKPKLNLHVVSDNWADIIRDFRLGYYSHISACWYYLPFLAGKK